MFDNFCRIHKTLRVTPDREAGVTKTLCSVRHIATLVEAEKAKIVRRKAQPLQKASNPINLGFGDRPVL
jgi:hypothetical protein